MTAEQERDLPIADLLPLRSMVVTLRFLQPCRPRFFHQGALTAFLRSLLDDHANYDRLIRVDSYETGRVRYRSGDYYRFTVTGLNGSHILLEDLICKLRRLPTSAPQTSPEIVFRDNWRLSALKDAFTEEPVDSVTDLSEYSPETLAQEVALWGERSCFQWRWVAPVRLLKDKELRKRQKGEARFCRDSTDTTGALLLNRLYDTFADLLRRRDVKSVPARHEPPALQVKFSHLFWVDSEYTDAEGRDHVMGGMAGQLTLQMDQPVPVEWWRLLVLGQHTGMGQRTAFGWGRYTLGTDEGGFTYRRGLPAASMLMRANADENLLTAWRHILSNRDKQSIYEDGGVDEPVDVEDDDVELDEAEAPLDRLRENMDKLQDGDYRFPQLRGHIIEDKDGGVRPLAIPPRLDRVLQRAVAQTLTPGIEQLMYAGSYGYRRGRSRVSASYDIQAAWRAGYRWVYESDIDDFFDSVDFDRLRDRLQALYDEDPVIDCIVSWMRAPVSFQGEVIERKAGLPQGSPLSPLMANLMLDDFDTDMRHAGFRLVRFADDFIVLCKDPEHARAAGEAARASLAEHGFRLNEDKTQITAMERGFRYLGYLFVNDMALDVSGQKSASGVEAKPPPSSWLAKLPERQPIKLEKPGAIARTARQVAQREPIQIGAREREGALICVTGASTLITTRNKRLQIHRDDTLLYDLPWQSLQAVILFGTHHITVPAMRAALQSDTPVHFASAMGVYDGVLWNSQPAQGHQLWLEQISTFADPDKALYAAREVVASRLRHMKETLRLRGQLNTRSIDLGIGKLHTVSTLAELHGVEGRAVRELFGCIAELIPDELGFDGRNRRPPRDPFNALLSLGYTLVYGYTESILRATGLFPWRGFYHQPHGRHAALASDLMEPFRHVVERAAMTVLLRGELTKADFTQTPAGACHIAPPARRKYLQLLIERFEQPVKAKGDAESKKLLVHLRDQAMSLRRWLVEAEPFRAWRMR